MGVDNTARLVIGWKLDLDALRALLASEHVGSCSPDEQCLCGLSEDACWTNIGQLVPKGFELVGYTTYYGGGYDTFQVFLRLGELHDGDAFTYPNQQLLLADLVQRVQNVDWEPARQLAVRAGAEDTAPLVIAAPYIW